MTTPARQEPLDRAERARRLREVAGVFLRLGATAFGGPAAHVALMEAELVRRRRWLDHAEFLDLLGASNLIPGPSSTELALHLGHRRAGWAGMAVAGIGFIVPAALMVTGLAALYLRFGQLPVSAGVLAGVKAVLIAVVLQALRVLGKAAVKSWGLALLGGASVLAQVLGLAEIWVLLGAGAVALLVSRARPRALAAMVPLPALLPALPLAAAPTLAGLFVAFVKIGALVFGSGYVLLAFLRAELVVARGWITEQQLLDAVAMGQVTPGPVFTAASFIGYLVAGGGGAAVATVGIFLPAVLAVALSGPLVPRLRASPAAAAFLDGVNVASLALMAVVTVQLARAALVDWPSVALALASAACLFVFGSKLHPGWLVGAGVAVGLLRTWLG